jgi:uncharacterized small protein (DUF1192 family)
MSAGRIGNRMVRAIVARALAASLAAGLCIVAPGAARAAEPMDRSIEQRLASLEAQIVALRAELQALRAGAPAPSGAATQVVAGLESKIDALTAEVERLKLGAAAGPPAGGSALGFGPAASKVYAARPGVSVGGYGEMLYQNFDQTADDGSRSSSVDPDFANDRADFLRAVLYFGYKFDDRFLFNSEIEFEHAVAGEGEPGEVAVEFAYIDYRATKSLGVRGGMVLVPLGFINELHEPPIFLGATRPEVERLIIPTTWRELGGGLYGETRRLSWRAYIVTGLDASGFSGAAWIRGGRQEGAEATATDFALTGRLDVTPVNGLLLGVSAWTGESGQGDPDLGGARTSLWDVHGQWDWRGLHVRALYARGTLDDAAAVSRSIGETIGAVAAGYYAEVGYNLLARRRRAGSELSPFVRYESLDSQKEAEAGSPAPPDRANDRTVRTLGVVWKPIPHIALKLDYQDFGNSAGTGVDRYNFALAYLF